MPNIKITVAEKIATNTTPGEVIVCGNSDYTVAFTFDAEWAAETERVARFVYYKDGLSLYKDQPFTGNTVAVPVLSGIDYVLVGVYAGNLRTTTPAKVLCDRSILCGSGLEVFAEGLPQAARQLLISILRGAVYSSDQSANIVALQAALAYTGETTETVTYSVTNNLTLVTSSNSAASVREGSSYKATLTAADGYVLGAVTVTMGGVDATSAVYSAGVVNIPAVTGDIVIIAVAVEAGEVVTNYTVTNELVNVTTNNSAASVQEGSSYKATLTAADGYVLGAVTVTMGGVDITATAYAAGVVTIASVTGNVEIVASASAAAVDVVLPEDGLVAFFDLRNVDVNAINTASLPGGGYGIPTATKGSASLYAWGAWVQATDNYGTTINRGLSVGAENTTTQIDLGTAYTFIGFTYGGYAGCNHTAAVNCWTVNPQYVKSDGSTTNVGNNQIVTTNNPGYLAAITRVDGAELTFFTNTTQVAAFDGANYDGFTKWVSGAAATITPYTTNGKFTAFALYNRALNDVEIAEAVAYLESLEVA